MNPLGIEPGVTRLFGVGDIGNRGLMRGFAPPECGCTWTDGPEAVLSLALPLPLRPLALAIEGEPYVSPAVRLQHVELFGNGRRLSAWWLRRQAPTVLRAAIDPDCLLVRRNRVLLMLTFVLPDATAPHDVGDSGDERMLAFCFRTLALNPVPRDVR